MYLEKLYQDYQEECTTDGIIKKENKYFLYILNAAYIVASAFLIVVIIWIYKVCGLLVYVLSVPIAALSIVYVYLVFHGKLFIKSIFNNSGIKVKVKRGERLKTWDITKVFGALSDERGKHLSKKREDWLLNQFANLDGAVNYRYLDEVIKTAKTEVSSDRVIIDLSPYTQAFIYVITPFYLEYVSIKVGQLAENGLVLLIAEMIMIVIISVVCVLVYRTVCVDMLSTKRNKLKNFLTVLINFQLEMIMKLND